MRFPDLVIMSINNLRRRKLRTVLTVLGVIIGTASIVVMVSLGIIRICTVSVAAFWATRNIPSACPPSPETWWRSISPVVSTPRQRIARIAVFRLYFFPLYSKTFFAGEPIASTALPFSCS